MMGIRPIQRIKHVVDASATLTAGTQLNHNVIEAEDAPTLALVHAVQTGSTVNGIFLRVEVASNETDAGAIPNFYMIVTKSQGDNITPPSPSAVGSDDNKRFVIHQEMIMMNNLAGGNPRTVFKGVVVIPKGFRRFGPNDRLYVSYLSPQVNVAVCLQAIYKEFR